MFQPQVGSDIVRHLFEPMNTLTAKDITDSIALTIKHNEPRAKLLAVDVKESSDYNTVVVNIIFSLINTNNPVSMDVTLKRVR
jgi:phage baseplate assembly protein W